MATFKDLFWPHEYSPPWTSFKYYTRRCTDPWCFRTAVEEEPYRACAEHAEQGRWLTDSLREAYNADPLFRLNVEKSVERYSPPPASVYWRISSIYRKERRHG